MKYLKILLLIAVLVAMNKEGNCQFSLQFTNTLTGASPGHQLVTLNATWNGPGTLNNTWASGNLSIRIPASAYGTGTASDIINISSPASPGILWQDAIMGGTPQPFKKSDPPFDGVGGTDDGYIYFVMSNSPTGNAPAFANPQTRVIFSFEVPLSWSCASCVQVMTSDDPFIGQFNTTTSFLNNAGYLGGAGNLLSATPANGPLPIKLSSFTAAKALTAVNLNWNISEELNAKSYTVERSGDGSSFTAIGSVTATGRGTYSFTDNSPLAGINFYRLKLVDKDASFTYSEVRRVTFGVLGTVFDVHPNPVVNTTLVLHVEQTVAEGKATAVFTDMAGRKVQVNTVQLLKGSQDIPVVVSGLAKGSYFVVLYNAAGESLAGARKVVKE